MTVALAHHHFTNTSHGRDDVARLERKDLIGIAVEQE